MKLRRMIAIWAAKIISAACRLSGKQGVTFAGKVALRIDPNILKDLSAQVREKIFVVCGTNGKTTTNNLLCQAIETEASAKPMAKKSAGQNNGNHGQKNHGQSVRVVCNHTGSNMLDGVAAAFVLAAKNDGTLDADYACIEIDEASTLRVFPHFKPDYMVLTNLFRDQLDRYGEIDITMDMLNRAMQMAPDMKIIVNADDALSAYLAMESGHEFITYGITERVFSEEEQGEQHEIREGRFCKKCGARLDYEFYHYSQIGKYNCPNCDFTRPEIDFEALHIDMTEGLSFDVLERYLLPEEELDSVVTIDDAAAGDGTGLDHEEEAAATREEADDKAGISDNGAEEKTDIDAGKDRIIHRYESRHLSADYRGFYNIYNILAAYAAGRSAGLKLADYEKVLKDFHPQNGRMEHFNINGSDVMLNLAKNPAGFNQNISAVMEDKKEKDIIIVINDNAQDGTDISWLWDVDFDRFGDRKDCESVKPNADSELKNADSKYDSVNADPSVNMIRSITVSGIRCQDMRLRMKYVDIPCEMIGDVKSAIEARLADGCGNLYVLVNYTALFSTRNILAGMQEAK
ncbi:MAG: MurT ligase domain-containing protein [Lachnospiraceae bacterium]|nr:MurT ligase domain-containing protein [Lachnospiraceae bacterium]